MPRKSCFRTAEEHLDFWLEHLEEPSFVYVIQAEPGTPIKVGVAKNPRSRLATLQTGNPAELRLLFVVPGSHTLEAGLHRRLKDSAVRGEWFAEPGIDGFLEWMDEFAAQGIVEFGLYGVLPTLPEEHLPEPPKRRGFGPSGDRNAKLGHRWRTGQVETAPITIRHTKPEPVMDIEKAREVRASFVSSLSTVPQSNNIILTDD